VISGMIIPFHQHRGLPRLVMVSQQAVADLAYDPPPGVPRSTAFRSRMACAFVMLGRSRVCLTTDGDDLALVEHRSASRTSMTRTSCAASIIRKPNGSSPRQLVAAGCVGSRSGCVVSLV
jgi:hypothetical protein